MVHGRQPAGLHQHDGHHGAPDLALQSLVHVDKAVVALEILQTEGLFLITAFDHIYSPADEAREVSSVGAM